jgi:hypothetical protein
MLVSIPRFSHSDIALTVTHSSMLWLSIPVVSPKICQRLLQRVCIVFVPRIALVFMCRQINRTGITTVGGAGSTSGTAT